MSKKLKLLFKFFYKSSRYKSHASWLTYEMTQKKSQNALEYATQNYYWIKMIKKNWIKNRFLFILTSEFPWRMRERWTEVAGVYEHEKFPLFIFLLSLPFHSCNNWARICPSDSQHYKLCFAVVCSQMLRHGGVSEMFEVEPKMTSLRVECNG